jgi:DNA-binding beta-propeller fold protein YncE
MRPHCLPLRGSSRDDGLPRSRSWPSDYDGLGGKRSLYALLRGADAGSRGRNLRSEWPTIATPADWGITPSGFARLLDAFTGSTPLRFVRPTGVAERNGILYIADPGAQALFVFDSLRGEAHELHRIGDEVLVSPVAVALGPADSLFIADSWLKKVIVMDSSGRWQRTIADVELVRPAGLAYDAVPDRLYVADSARHQIVVFSSSGQFLQRFGSHGTGDAEFNSPTHLTLAAHGELLVTDALNYRVQAFDVGGHFLWKIGRHGDGSGDFAAPKGIATDSTGDLYVVDALFDAVQIFRADGPLLLGFGERGTNPGQFWLPGGLFIDAEDTVYVADSYNKRIQIFQRVRTFGP